MTLHQTSKFLTFKYWKKVLEKFILLLRNSVMCYECIDLWDIYKETSLPLKE